KILWWPCAHLPAHRPGQEKATVPKARGDTHPDTPTSHAVECCESLLSARLGTTPLQGRHRPAAPEVVRPRAGRESCRGTKRYNLARPHEQRLEAPTRWPSEHFAAPGSGRRATRTTATPTWLPGRKSRTTARGATAFRSPSRPRPTSPRNGNAATAATVPCAGTARAKSPRTSNRYAPTGTCSWNAGAWRTSKRSSPRDWNCSAPAAARRRRRWKRSPNSGKVSEGTP